LVICTPYDRDVFESIKDAEIQPYELTEEREASSIISIKRVARTTPKISAATFYTSTLDYHTRLMQDEPKALLKDLRELLFGVIRYRGQGGKKILPPLSDELQDRIHRMRDGMRLHSLV
jgi:hypothetical protein